MLAEALKLLIATANDANPARRIVTAPAEPPHVYYVQQADGSLVRTDAENKPDRHTAADLATLVAWAVGPQTPYPDPDPFSENEIWYSRIRVVAGAHPGDDQCDRCTLPLAPSPQLAYLTKNEAAKGETLDQAGLIRLLRTTLAGCWGGDLLASVRKVNVSKAKAVESEQQKGKVSLSYKSLAEMSGANDLPDEIAFDVPVFSAGSIAARATVRVCLELNPETERFTLTVLPGQTEAALTRGETWLMTTLEEHLGDNPGKVPVYYGEP